MTDQDLIHGSATTGGGDPQAMRRQIERTRSDLSRDVSTLTEKVNPSRVARRQVGRARGAATSLTQRVMGAPSSAAHSASSSISETAGSAVGTTRSKTEGNPLAAGLIAFGVGWLVSSLIPASDPERQAATALKDTTQEHSAEIVEPLKEAASEAANQLSGPAREAVTSVKDVATESSQST